MSRVSTRPIKVWFTSAALCLLSACSLPSQLAKPSSSTDTNAQEVATGTKAAQAAYRAGRFSLVVDTEPQQSFLSSFDIQGGWPDGVLTIYNPLGMQMARVEWTPQGARLIQGSQIRQAVSLESLIFQLTGTQLPAAALIDWLGGRPTPAEGWKVDVSEWHLRRLVLERIQPAPRTVLRIAFES
jgi:outer membrane lipoprotein LolB